MADITSENAEQVVNTVTTHVQEDVTNAVTGLSNGDFSALILLLNEYVLPIGTALLIIVVGYFVSKFIARICSAPVTQRVDQTLGKFISKLIFYGMMIFTILGVLGRFGISVASFAAVIAAAGFAVGLAFQGTLSNFASGVLLLVFRPFKVKDYIQAGGVEGEVLEIDLFTTHLKTLDNISIIVPNSEIAGGTIHNLTSQPHRRVDVNVGADYGADLKLTQEAILEAGMTVQKQFASATSEPEAYLVELGDSSVNWQARLMCAPSDYWAVRQALTWQVKEHLDKANISIPYPQLDLHIPDASSAKLEVVAAG